MFVFLKRSTASNIPLFISGPAFPAGPFLYLSYGHSSHLLQIGPFLAYHPRRLTVALISNGLSAQRMGFRFVTS